MSAGPALAGPARYLPHEADAVLLDEVWQHDERVTRGSAVVRAGTPFCDDREAWPAWLIIELMAQVVAASAGLREFRAGVRPRLGLLLGVRSFASGHDRFAVGTALEVEAIESTRDEFGMGVYDCLLTVSGERVASAILSVYLPQDVDEYLGSIEP